MSSVRPTPSANRLMGRGPLSVLRLAALIASGLLLATAATPVSAQTSGDVTHARADRDAAYKRVESVQDEMEAALVEYDRAHTRLEEVEEKVALTQRQLEVYRIESSDLDALAREAIIEAYINTGSNDVAIALVADTFQDLMMAQHLGEHVRERQLDDLQRLLAVSREVERLNDGLEADRVVMAALAAEAQSASQLVQVSLESAQHALADAERDYEGIKVEYEAEQRKKREAELARIRDSSSKSVRGLPASATQGFVCPVQGGAAFINSWGFPRSGGRTHKGVDMFAKRGTPTPAVNSGTIKMRTVNLGGIVTYLYGDDGNKYYYAHLNGYPAGLRDGQRVERGQAIGFVGNSGNAEGTSPHLHFEIRPGGGGAVNPYPTVRPACP